MGIEQDRIIARKGRHVAIVIAIAYIIFVALRLKTREAPEEELQEPFQPLTAQAPYTPEMAPLQEEEADT